jgi:DNA-binding transcriptional MerR regulator
MSSAKKPSSAWADRVFLSADVSQLAAITLRQLQWWDERRIISPRKQGHRRLYTLRQVLEILTAADLRHKGLSLQKVRRILRLLRRQLPRTEASHPGRSWFLLTDGESVHLEQRAEDVIRILADARKPMYLIPLSAHIERLTAEQTPHRHAPRQLPLF